MKQIKDRILLRYPSRFYIGQKDYLALLEMFYDDIRLWSAVNHREQQEIQMRCRGWEGLTSTMTVRYEIRKKKGHYRPYPYISVFPVEGNATLGKEPRLSEMGITHLVFDVRKGRRRERILLFPLNEEIV